MFPHVLGRGEARPSVTSRARFGARNSAKHFVTLPRLDLTAETDLARVCATDYARPIGAPQNVATIKKVRQRQERQDSAGLQKSLFLDRHPDNSVNPVWYQ